MLQAGHATRLKMPKLVFIISTHEKRTQRHHELQTATARAHAASVSYRRRVVETSAVSDFGSAKSSTPTPKFSKSNPANDTSTQPDCNSRSMPALHLTKTRDELERSLQEHHRSMSIMHKSYHHSLGTSPWHWTNGTRRDPFNCFSDCNSRGAMVGLDYCEPDHSAKKASRLTELQ